MKDNGRKKENFPESSKAPEDSEMVEIKAIRDKLCDMHSDIKKVMEYSNRLRFETAMECSRQEYSNAVLSHLIEDIDTGLERNMVKKCPEKENCRSSFTALLQKNAGLVKQGRVDEVLLSGNREKLEELRCGAPYSKCDQCFSEVSSLFTKQVNLMRSMRIYADNQEQKSDISALETGALMREVLEPVSNPQRLEILRAVAFETKSFSAFSEITGLRGGNLLFHLQKLMDSELILQQHERGDYMITEKGFKILQGLNELYSSLQYSPLQIPASKTPGEKEEIRI